MLNRQHVCYVLYFGGTEVIFASYVGIVTPGIGWIGWVIGMIGWILWPGQKHNYQPPTPSPQDYPRSWCSGNWQY